MFLSEAIARRQQALEKAEAMDKWAKEQQNFKTGQLRWHEMKVAIDTVVDKAFEEYHKYNEAIEKDIKQLEIEI